MEIRCGTRLFVVDAGSGLNACGLHHREALPKEIDLLFSHLHLDHAAGLPFFKPVIFNPERTINTYCGNLDGDSAKATLDRLFSPPLFPVTLDVIPCTFSHHGFKAGESLSFADGARVDTILLNHPQGSVGYRFDHAGKRLCIISDIEHLIPGLTRPCAASLRVLISSSTTACSRKPSIPAAAAGDTPPGRRASNWRRRLGRRLWLSFIFTRRMAMRSCAAWRPRCRP